MLLKQAPSVPGDQTDIPSWSRCTGHGRAIGSKQSNLYSNGQGGSGISSGLALTMGQGPLSLTQEST